MTTAKLGFPMMARTLAVIMLVGAVIGFRAVTFGHGEGDAMQREGQVEIITPMPEPMPEAQTLQQEGSADMVADITLAIGGEDEEFHIVLPSHETIPLGRIIPIPENMVQPLGRSIPLAGNDSPQGEYYNISLPSI